MYLQLQTEGNGLYISCVGRGSQGITELCLYSKNQPRMSRGLEYPVILLACSPTSPIFVDTAITSAKRVLPPGQLSPVADVWCLCPDVGK